MIENASELRIRSPVSERCRLKGRPSRSRLAMQLKVQQNIHFNEQIYQTLDKSIFLVFYEGTVAKKIVNSFFKKFSNSETRVPLLPPTLVPLLSMIMSRYMMMMMMAMMTVMMMMMIVGASKSYVQERRQEGFGSVRDPRGERRCPSTQYIHIPFSFSVTFPCNH